jgi:UDP-3-O-[3-hydroxymyristoyl] glucosamine N-acyltransferase
VIAPSAAIGAGAAIGAHVVIGERSSVGSRCTLGPGTVLGDDVILGEASQIASNVSIRERCRIGARAIIHAGAVIGADGFGFAPKPDGTYEKIPHRGTVVIEDDVEIGANSTIDRATIGETRLCTGVKLDNLVQVAHNVVIGEHTVIAAQSGISGSTRIGKHCMVAGQVGFAGHLEIADHTSFGAQSGVPKSVTKPGATYFGTPAKELHQRLRIEAALTELPELLAQVRSLKEQLDRLGQDLAKLMERSTNR